ncbi:MAG: hypothetical protein ACI8Y4_002996 [Candidatus Poriferisodalaceae bacterium]
MSDQTFDLDAIKAEWIGVEFETLTFEPEVDRMVAWAEACGETDARFIDPTHPDFQAPPNLTTVFNSGKFLPDGFPAIGNGFGIDGGKTVECLAPIRAGDVLTGTATLADIFDKTGRSGTMVFIVQRMSFKNQNDEPVSVVDWKTIRGV